MISIYQYIDLMNYQKILNVFSAKKILKERKNGTYKNGDIKKKMMKKKKKLMKETEIIFTKIRQDDSLVKITMDERLRK